MCHNLFLKYIIFSLQFVHSLNFFSRDWNPGQNEAVKDLGEAKFSQLATETKIIRSRLEPPKHVAEPIVQPVNLTSTYRIPSVQQFEDMLLDGGNIYGRIGN